MASERLYCTGLFSVPVLIVSIVERTLSEVEGTLSVVERALSEVEGTLSLLKGRTLVPEVTQLIQIAARSRLASEVSKIKLMIANDIH
ncbi:MAG: hypothetical protein JWQ40_1572 [Segetibacter sp.]|nr:hypothetical protein [Segetibacter sp.]